MTLEQISTNMVTESIGCGRVAIHTAMIASCNPLAAIASQKGWESGRCEEWTVVLERSGGVIIRISPIDLRDSRSKAMLRSADRDGL